MDGALKDFIDGLKPPRHVRQTEIEKQLLAFLPDATEFQELLATLVSSFERRYEENEDVTHYAKYLAAAAFRLEEEIYLDLPDENEEFELDRARKAGGL